jgi:hypothetical protein
MERGGSRTPPSPQVQAAQSRHAGRSMEFAALAATAAAAALALAGAAGELLGKPLADARASLIEANAATVK